MGRLRPSGSPPAPPPTSVGQGPSLATERCPRTLPSGPTVEGTGISCSGDIGLPADGSHTACVISLSLVNAEDDGAVQGRGVAFGSAREGCSGEQARHSSRSKLHLTPGRPRLPRFDAAARGRARTATLATRYTGQPRVAEAPRPPYLWRGRAMDVALDHLPTRAEPSPRLLALDRSPHASDSEGPR
jgi:hypothetical protein